MWHVQGISYSPTITGGPGAGTAPTLSIVGNDVFGQITMATGTSPTASGTSATITYGGAWVASVTYCKLTPSNANAAVLSGASQVYAPAGASTTFTIVSRSTALTASTTYTWTYSCGS
jgi:hypothetical protein